MLVELLNRVRYFSFSSDNIVEAVMSKLNFVEAHLSLILNTIK